MSKIFWKSLIATPALLGASLLLSTGVKAEGEQFFTAQATPDNNSELLEQLDNYSSEGGANSNDQVTSVSQLRDVSPTDWAYEALRSLVERYGCIVGYPDRTFRGNRATSRYEFAAGLNACMQQMERLIASSEAVLREDIEKLKRLMREFEAELAALGARVDNLEGRVAFLEDHQFSTTTKLKGEAIIALTQAFNNGTNENQAILVDRVRLVLETSFSGEDTLVTRLAAGSGDPFNATFDTTLRTPGYPIERISDPVESATLTQTFFDSPSNNNNVEIDWLAYYFPIDLSEDSRIQGYFAGFGGLHYDYAPTLNPYFEDFNGGNGSLSTFAQRNPIYSIGGGAGASVSYQAGFLEGILGPTTVTAGYLAGGEPGSPQGGNGIFNGDYAALGQINFNISDTFAVGFTYVHGFHKASSPIFGQGGRGGPGLVGTTQANNNRNQIQALVNSESQLFADEWDLIDPIVDFEDKTSNSYGAQAAWRINDGMSLSAYFTYTSLILNGRGNDQIWTYGGGLAFPDLGKEGSVLGIFAGVQPYSGNSRVFLTGTNSDGETVSRRTRLSNSGVPIHVEGFYKYQLNDNISITPGVIWISSPSQSRNSDDEVIGTLRTTFTF
jgi:BMFP domain-containing protein YqiC